MSITRHHLLAAVPLLFSAAAFAQPAQQTRLDVSCDVGRELCKAYDTVFAAHGKKTTGATTSCARRHIGGALVSFESAVPSIQRAFGVHFGVVYPGRTILAEACLQFLNGEEGQELATKFNRRPRSPKVLAKHAKAFPKVNTFTVDEVFGGWTKAQKDHFNDGALYDQVIAVAKAR